MATKIKFRGRLTIPKKIRAVSHLEEGRSSLSFQWGLDHCDTQEAGMDEARSEIKKILKASALLLKISYRA